jgi:leader peptidase (prepilin peptidase)/N-methyltransferase
MNLACAVAVGLFGAIAGAPAAGIAHAVPTVGQVRLPSGWWRGGSAPVRFLIGSAVGIGAVTAVLGAALPASAAVLAFFVFAVVGVALAIIDVRRLRLPYVFTGIALASSTLSFGIAAIAGAGLGPLIRSPIVGLSVAVTLFVLALALPGQLGLGDVAFASTGCFTLGWLSWQAALCGILGGLLLQAAAVVLGIFQRAEPHNPLGPALLAGWMVSAVLFR